jgi:hypothetical protein
MVKFVAVWIKTSCFLLGGYNVSEVRTVFICRSKIKGSISHQNTGNQLPIYTLS